MHVTRLPPEAPGPTGDVAGPLPGVSRSVVTIGNFDGVHRGHQALVSQAVAEARARGVTSVVMTFDPHPQQFLFQDGPPALTTVDQKAELIAVLGVEHLVVLTFDRTLAAASPREFVDRHVARALRAVCVVVGDDFRFGQARRGDVAALRAIGLDLGFDVRSLGPLQHDRQPISSTRVRQALAAGDVATAGVLLGRPFTLDGDVVPGDGRGRTLGIPTANIRSSGLLPAHGVYAGWCLVRARAGESRWRAVMNIGARPTFGAGKTTVEAHLIDFSGDLYGSPVRVDLRERLRPERRFDGPDALKAQIAADIARALQLLR